jgi:DNA-binding NtrC family response regulator
MNPRPLTTVRTGEYIKRESAGNETRKDIENQFLLLDETPFEGDHMRYALKKIDLERMTPEQAAYRDKLTVILRDCRWNVALAARKCKLSRASMYRRLHVLSIKIPTTLRRGRSIFDHKIAGVK